MKWMLDLEVTPSAYKISYKNKILFIGSCFSQEIGSKLKELKFTVLQNPNGILYDPVSIGQSLVSYIDNRQYESTDLFLLNELWHSWQYHSEFSGVSKNEVLNGINSSQGKAHDFITGLDWLIISVGSSFHYTLANGTGPVANCHKAPSSFFKKELLNIHDIVEVLGNAIGKLTTFSSKLRIVLTVSPVRHIRDGVVENNRSKARLLEAVHTITTQFDNLYYFPAYELLIDVLRDYRFYKKDMVHPDETATQYIFEKFTECFIENDAQIIMQQVEEIQRAVKHAPYHTSTGSYASFKKNQLERVVKLQQVFPSIDLSTEINHFSG